MRKGFIRLAALSAATVLSLGSLAACGGKTSSTDTNKTPDSGDKVKTTVANAEKFKDQSLVYWSNFEKTEPQGKVLSAAVEDFNKQTGAKVQVEFKGRKGIKEGLIPALDAGQKVDLFDGQGNKSNYGERIVPLDDYVDEGFLSKSNPTLIELTRSYYKDGKLYELPFQFKGNAYLYNKGLFKKAGISTVPKTWKDFLDVCEKLKAAGITPLTTDDAYAMQAFGMHLARLVGSDKVKDIVDNGKWEEPAVLETAKAFAELATKGYFVDKVGSNAWPTGQNTQFALGKAAMYCTGTFLVNEVKNLTGPDFEWGFFGYPELEGGVNGLEAMVMGSQSFSVTNKCQNVELAVALVKHITRGHWDAEFAKECIGIPSDSDNAELYPAQLAEARPYFEKCTTIFPVSGGLENNPEITPSLKENLMKLYAGALSPEDFVKNMKASAKK